jgi:transcription antitermination factor NusG
MPILAAETSLFPDDLLNNPGEPAGSGRWRVAMTKPRQEKALARDLIDRAVPFYLPLVGKESLVRGRRRKSFLPLFGGYTFLHASDEQRLTALNTGRIAHVLETPEQERLLADLRQIHHLIESGAPMTIEERLEPGRKVRVKSGAMMGLTGTVLSRRNRTLLLVAVDFLQRGVSVAIDDFMLEPVDL